MRRVKYLAAVLAMAMFTGQTKEANAWSEDTHQELAKQSILYMLRSDNPTLRFVGTVMMKAGEGGKISPNGKRSWRLADEAENVDHYVDVHLKNKGFSVDPDNIAAGYEVGALLHEFQGNNFTAYNHFLLFDEGGRDTSSWSHDNYTTSCENLASIRQS